MTEKRMATVLEVRTTEDGVHEADVRIVSYDKIDSYRTTFAPGSFTRAVTEGVIPSVFSHDPSRPIGVVTHLRNNNEALDGTLEFLDFDSCPDAKLVYEAMKKGAIRGVSFGFERLADEADPNNRGVTRITEVDVFETSPVLRNAVPGSKVLAVRSDDPTKTLAIELLNRLSVGDIDVRQAIDELSDIELPTSIETPLGLRPQGERSTLEVDADIAAIDNLLKEII